MGNDFVEADAGARLRFFAFLLLILVFVMFWDSFVSLMIPDDLFLSYDTLKVDVKKAVEQSFWVWLVIAFISWTLAAYIMRIAVRVIRSRQWPAPGMKMPFRMQVYRGRKAKYLGVSIGVVAMLLFIKPIISLYAVARFSLSSMF